MSDLIKRSDVLDLAKTGKLVSNGNYKSVVASINSIPSAEQVAGKLNKRDDSLLTGDSSECKKQKSKLDLISRQDIIYRMQLEPMGNGQYDHIEVAYKSEIEALPSADRPKGEWVEPTEGNDYWECSECHERIVLEENVTPKYVKMHFCPNCGADMRGKDDE